MGTKDATETNRNVHIDALPEGCIAILVEQLLQVFSSGTTTQGNTYNDKRPERRRVCRDDDVGEGGALMASVITTEMTSAG